MYNSKLFKKEPQTLDLTWFHSEVEKFNTIGNPDGVDLDKQKELVIEEVQEIIDSKTEKEFIDGVIDSFFVLAPFCNKEEFTWDYENYQLMDIKPFKDYLVDYLEDYKGGNNESLFGFMWLLLNLSFGEQELITVNAKSVVESNLSKFIPESEYKEDYLQEVCKKYPDVAVTVDNVEYDGVTYKVFRNSITKKVLKGHSYFKDAVIVTELEG